MEKSTRIRVWFLGSVEAGKRFIISTWAWAERFAKVLFVLFMIFILCALLVTRTQPAPKCTDNFIWLPNPGACIPGYVPTEVPREQRN